MERAFLVIQSEKKRTDPILSALVPPEAGNHAVGRANVLHFDHRPLARLIGSGFRLGNHTVETSAFELVEPPGRHFAIPRHRREVKWRLCLGEKRLEFRSPD